MYRQTQVSEAGHRIEREGLEEEIFSKSSHWADISGPQFCNMDEIVPGSL